MAALPTPDYTTASAVYAFHAARVAGEPARPYLGWSALGDPCERALWYGFRWAGARPLDGRTARLFQTGHLEEARLLGELRAIGLEVWDRDEQGGQFGVSSLGGHLRGHADAIVRGLPEAPATPHLVDVKTIKSKKFDELLKKGMRAMYPKYHAQGTGYMGHLKLTRAAFIFVCKDDDRIHTERFEFDPAEFRRLEEKAARVIGAAMPPLRLSEDPAWHECKFCDFHSVCHGGRVPDVSCRTCAHATPAMAGDAGTWTCKTSGGSSVIPIDVQRTGCEAHLYIPPLLAALGTPVDGSDAHVEYEATDGGRFVNGPSPGFASVEIRAAASVAVLVDPDVQAVKAAVKTARVVA